MLSSFACGRQTSLVVDAGHAATVGELCQSCVCQNRSDGPGQVCHSEAVPALELCQLNTSHHIDTSHDDSNSYTVLVRIDASPEGDLGDQRSGWNKKQYHPCNSSSGSDEQLLDV